MAIVEGSAGRLERPRPPRVRITYEVGRGGTREERELPFVVGILADLAGRPEEEPPRLAERKFIDVHRDNFHQVLAAVAPRLAFRVPNRLVGDGSRLSVELRFRRLSDFHPNGVVRGVGPLAELLEARRLLAEVRAELDRRAEMAALGPPTPPPLGPGRAPALPVAAGLGVEALARQRSWRYAGPVLEDLLAPVFEGASRGAEALARLERGLARIDDLLDRQLGDILHHPDFRRLEASWRGLFHLVRCAETGPRLRLRVLSVTREELQRDLERALEVDQSALFKKVYEEEYGIFGGHPFGLLVGDYELGRRPLDLRLLEGIAGVAAAAHAPFVAAAAPGLFGLERFADLERPRSLAPLFASPELARWDSFRRREDSRYVALTLPRVLLRLPWGPETDPVEGFPFREEVDPGDRSRCLWGSAVWPLAERIANAFARYGWCPALRGIEGGGRVRGLPVLPWPREEQEGALTGPTEVVITDRREKELDALGFLALCRRRGAGDAAFFGARTVQEPRLHDTAAANANARISTLLPYMLTASRFAHYLKVICRDKLGRFQTAEEVAEALNRWIGGYVLGRDDAGPELKARYPLREARVDVSEVPGRPGHYRAVVFLRPHFQLDDLTTSLRLVVALPPPVA